MSEDKITKEDLKEEKLQVFFLKLVQIFVAHRLKIITAASVILITVLSFLGYKYYEQNIFEKNSAEMFELEKKLPDLDYASNDDVNKYLFDLKTIADREKNTIFAWRAMLVRSIVLEKSGFPDKAIEELNQVSASAGSNSVFGELATFQQAKIEIAEGNFDKARELLGVPMQLFEERRLFELGMLQLTEGNKEDARKSFRDLINQFPNTTYSQSVNNILEVF